MRNQLEQHGMTTVWKTLNSLTIVIAFVVIIAVFSVLSPQFFRPVNFVTIGMAAATLGIVAIGQSLILITGNFDLSVGQNVALSGILTAMLSRAGVPFLYIIPIILLLGVMIGAINASLITKAKINAFIVTLGMLTILQGIVYVITGGEYISSAAKDFRVMGKEPRPIIYILVFYAIFYVITRYTVFGRYVYAIGGNKDSARLSGINVDNNLFAVYMISGFLAAFAGISLASRLGAASTGIGLSYPLDSIAASVIGGISLAGGTGNILFTLIGVLIITSVSNGLIIVGVPSSYQYLATGIILILAVLTDSLKTRRA
jgi:ribose transport system permease protein